MIGSSRSYAIGMAHFQIAGGIKTLLLVCGVYLLMFCMGLSLYYYMDISSGMRSGLSSAIVTLLMVFEAVVLIVLGSFRVASAIRTDVSSRMIESHRLMPVPGWRAVMGYIFGGTTHAIAFALLNVVLAYIFAGVTSTSLVHVTFNQAMLFSFAVLVWTLTALATLLFRYAYFVALAAFFMGGCVLLYAYMALPGFALLVGPMIGDSIFNFSGPQRASTWCYAASILAQAAFVALLFAGACRRYRGTYPTTFSNLQALLLMLTWCAASLVGLALWDGFHFGPDMPNDAWLRRSQIIASVASAMIFALVPISTVTGARVRRMLPQLSALIFCVLGAAAIPLGIAWAVSWPHATMGWGNSEIPELHGDSFAITAMIVAAHVLTLFAALVLLRKTRPWIKWVTVGLGLLGYWMLPLILELVRVIIEKPAPDEARFGVLGTLSPLGLLITTWNGMEKAPSPLAGLVVQCGLAAALAAVMFMRGNRPARPAMRVPPPAGATPDPFALLPVPATPGSDPLRADRPESGSP